MFIFGHFYVLFNLMNQPESTTNFKKMCSTLGGSYLDAESS